MKRQSAWGILTKTTLGLIGFFLIGASELRAQAPDPTWPLPGVFQAGRVSGCMLYPDTTEDLESGTLNCFGEQGHPIGIQLRKQSETFGSRSGKMIARDGQGNLVCMAYYFRAIPENLKGLARDWDLMEYLPLTFSSEALQAWYAVAGCSTGSLGGAQGLLRNGAREAAAAGLAAEAGIPLQELALGLDQKALWRDAQLAVDADGEAAVGVLLRNLAQLARSGERAAQEYLNRAQDWASNGSIFEWAQQRARQGAPCPSPVLPPDWPNLDQSGVSGRIRAQHAATEICQTLNRMQP